MTTPTPTIGEIRSEFGPDPESRVKVRADLSPKLRKSRTLGDITTITISRAAWEGLRFEATRERRPIQEIASEWILTTARQRGFTTRERLAP